MDGLGAQLKSLKRARFRFRRTSVVPWAAERRTRAARALPPPLYVLYTQLAAAKEAFAEDIDVSIEGSRARTPRRSREERRRRERKRRRRRSGETTEGRRGGVVSGSKLEDGDDEDGERTRKRARTSTGAGEDGDDPYATHPLAVVLVEGSGSATRRFGITWRYAAVSCETRASLDADLLVNLFPDDDGEESPNAANALRWRGFRWDADGRRRERPFRWCQHLAGVDFLPAAPRAGLAEAVHEGVATHQRQARVRHVLAARARTTSRAKLKCESRLFRECILEPNPGERECILSRTRTRTNPKPGKSNLTVHPTPPHPSQEPARRARARRDVDALRRRASSRDATQVRAHIVARDDERSRRRRRTRADACDGSRTGTGPDQTRRPEPSPSPRVVSVRRFARRIVAGLAAGTASTSSPTSSSPPSFRENRRRSRSRRTGAAPRPPPPSDVDADVDAGARGRTTGERPANDRGGGGSVRDDVPEKRRDGRRRETRERRTRGEKGEERRRRETRGPLTGVPSRWVSASRASKASIARRVASTRRVKLARRASTSSTAARDAEGESARRMSSRVFPGDPESSEPCPPRVEPEGLHAALAGTSARVPNAVSDTIPRARHARARETHTRARRTRARRRSVPRRQT